VNPFDIVTDISLNKKKLIDETNQKEYSPFMVNRALSYYIDTIMYANDMNINHHVDKLMQHDYLFYSIRKAKRFSKWAKKKKDSDIELIQEYYGYSYDKAKVAVSVLTDNQIKIIKKKLDKGGV
jgi:hypothetical protein